MNLAVPDASLILQYFLEPDSKQAAAFDRMLRKAGSGTLGFIAPHLLTLEVANGLRFSQATASETRRFLDALFAIPIEYAPLGLSAHHNIASWASELNATVYDVSYHMLAWQLGATFVTCDHKYYQRAQSKGYIECV